MLSRFLVMLLASLARNRECSHDVCGGDWGGSFDRAGHSLCKQGCAMRGMCLVYRSGGTSLFNLEEARCCNVNNPLSETCQEEDIGISFDSQGWAKCQDDHYMVGLIRSDCDELYCIEGLSCCKGGDGSLINCDARDDEWDKFDSEGWWKCPGDKVMTGMWRSHGNSLSNIEKLRCCDYVLPPPPPPFPPGMAPKPPPPVEPASIAVVDCYSTGVPSWLTEMNKPHSTYERGRPDIFNKFKKMQEDLTAAGNLPKQNYTAASACQIKELDSASLLGQLCPAGTEAVPPRSEPAPRVKVDGPCKLNKAGTCVTSPNYPENYHPSESCTIRNVPSTFPLRVSSFSTEGIDKNCDEWSRRYGCCDYLKINGKKYCGNNGPDGVRTRGYDITWYTDKYIGDTGWELCWPHDTPPSPEDGVDCNCATNKTTLGGDCTCYSCGETSNATPTNATSKCGAPVGDCHPRSAKSSYGSCYFYYDTPPVHVGRVQLGCPHLSCSNS